MPLTPFHLGPDLFFGLLFFSYVDFPTFLVANVIVDIEPILVSIDAPSGTPGVGKGLDKAGEDWTESIDQC